MKRTGLPGRAGSRTRVLLALALACAALGVGAPAHAKHYGGSVLLPVGHPTIPRTIDGVASFLNGVTGSVIELAPHVDGGTPYTIEDETGRPGTDFDVWWYPDLDIGTSPCPFSGEDPSGPNKQAGVVLCDAEYAIVVLFTGFASEFDLSV